MRRTTILALAAAISLIGCSKKADDSKSAPEKSKPAAATQKAADDKPAAKPEAKAEAKPKGAVKEEGKQAEKVEAKKAEGPKFKCPEGTIPDIGTFSLCKDADGKKHGPFVQTSEDGSKVLVTGQYDKGQKIGEWVKFTSTGDKTVENWAAGKRNGKTTMFKKDGGKYRDIFYKNGKMHGPMTIYKNDGSVQIVVLYENGKSVSK